MNTNENLVTQETCEIVRKSFGRALLKGDVIQRFYEIFLESDPRIKPMFANTDFSKQKDLLRHGINLMIMFAEGKASGKSGVSRIGKSHDHGHMNIEPALYDFWEKSLYQAINEFDPDFDVITRRSWKNVIEYGTDYIKSQYPK